MIGYYLEKLSLCMAVYALPSRLFGAHFSWEKGLYMNLLTECTQLVLYLGLPLHSFPFLLLILIALRMQLRFLNWARLHSDSYLRFITLLWLYSCSFCFIGKQLWRSCLLCKSIYTPWTFPQFVMIQPKVLLYLVGFYVIEPKPCMEKSKIQFNL